jgi:hypothetical protein
MNEKRKHQFVIYGYCEGTDHDEQVKDDLVAESDGLDLDMEGDCIRVCRHFPECPYTPPPGDEDCPGCRANEQYADEGPGLILSRYQSSVSS